jgi:hypothetical protein
MHYNHSHLSNVTSLDNVLTNTNFTKFTVELKIYTLYHYRSFMLNFTKIKNCMLYICVCVHTLCVIGIFLV